MNKFHKSRDSEILREILIDENEIAERVKYLGGLISGCYFGKRLLLVGILKGSLVFMSDLIRHIKIPCEIEFIEASSYKEGTESSGHIQMVKDFSRDLSGHSVIVIEDIIDTGRTLEYIKKALLEKGADSVEICVLLNKPERREVDISPDFEGFKIPNIFVAGYGLDYNEKFRNVPYIIKI